MELANNNNNYGENYGAPAGTPGTTYINGGVIQLGAASALGNSIAAVNANNGLTFNPGIVTFTAAGLSGSANFTLADTGGAAVSLVVGNNLNNATSVYSGIMSGSSGSLTKSGTSTTLVLTGANTYGGATTITGGVLLLGNNTATGSLNPSSTIADNGTLAFYRTNTVVQGTDFSNSIGGSGGLTQKGSGTVYLTTANSYSGGTTISAGTVQLGDANAVQNSTVTVNANNGLTFNSGIGTFNFGGLAGSAELRAGRHERRRREPHRRRQQRQHQLQRRDERLRRLADQGRQRHAQPSEHQHLHRRHDRQRRHVGAQRQ